MEPLYDPKAVEPRWQHTWEEEGHYNAEPGADAAESFVIMHPPPNISGSLTIGHCLQLSLEDALVRWHRMRGFNTLFQPGYDHAGISTWAAIGREFANEGKTQRDLGREGFDEYVQAWLKRYGGTIMSQFRTLGASLDYRRERFTMDPGYYAAVIRWFVHLYDKGWIYRGNRIVNWCPKDQTALSDLEVEHEERDDTLSSIRYPLANGSGHITIATVRPATILADVAVAVHPDDDRYRDLVGKEVIVPFVERRVPVIADERVEPEFGTGALKVTPGHDPLDFEIGRAHGLPEPAMIGPDGRMNDRAGELAGLTQEEAGDRILAWVRERGQLVKRESYRHSVALCERCKSRIEPLISLQWWCRMDELKQPALAALRARRVRYHPESQHRFAIDSLENAPDWNISRQIWWGHQLPVWECPDGHLTVAETEPDVCGECGSRELERSTNVLDTWFSSALWPFATLGWPEDTEDLRTYYPTSVLVTARDIIFLWVSRMVMAALKFVGCTPFHDVVVTGTVLDKHGQRMSKTKNNGIDPLEVFDKYGVDATRLALASIGAADTRWNDKQVESYRNFANKIWNAARFCMMNAEGVESVADPFAGDYVNLPLHDR